MTLEELDNGLRDLGLKLDCDSGIRIKNEILTRHGNSILREKSIRCQRCWMKEIGGCRQTCNLYSIPDNPLEASIKYISAPNDIDLFAFVYLYVIPVYEKETGTSNVIKRVFNRYKELMKNNEKTQKLI